MYLMLAAHNVKMHELAKQNKTHNVGKLRGTDV